MKDLTNLMLVTGVIVFLITLVVVLIVSGCSIAYADLDVGEPRTVRMIYFLPNDRPYQESVAQWMKDALTEARFFYQENMDARGYRNTTFTLETDKQSQPIVHRIDGKPPNQHYFHPKVFDAISDEISQHFDLNSNVYFAVIDHDTWAVGGAGRQFTKSGGLTLVTQNFNFDTVTHELGHAFGLVHDFRSKSFIMSYGPGQNYLSTCNAHFLSAHPHFNTKNSIDNHRPPSIDIISPTLYKEGLNTVKIRASLDDSDGIHQALLVLKHPFDKSLVLENYQNFNGEKSAMVEFEYDGNIYPKDHFESTTLDTRKYHSFHLIAVDVNGNHEYKHFMLSKVSKYHLRDIVTPFENQRFSAYMKFSPDNKRIALLSDDNSVIRIWNIENDEQLELSDGKDAFLTSMAFHPNGYTIAVGSRQGIIFFNASDGKKRFTIGRIGGHSGSVGHVVYSPVKSRNPILASGGSDRNVILWDVLKRKQIAVFGHNKWIMSIAFSPDEKNLAVATNYTVTLWNISTRQQISMTKYKKQVRAVMFSPDGKLFITVMAGGSIKVWDTKTNENINDFRENFAGFATTPSFLPNSSILAQANQSKVIVWDVITGQTIDTVEHDGNVFAVDFSHNGALC